MLTPFLTTLLLLSQAPPSPEEPITVLIAPPDTAGVPSHVVEFAQEHLAEQARTQGLGVKRMKEVTQRMRASKRRALLRCKRTELKCLISLGTAAKTEVVLVAELLQRLDGYRVGTKAYRSKDGALLAEHLISGVREDGMLDALTQSLEVVVPELRKELRPSATPPVEEVKPPPDSQVIAQQTPETKPPETKPPETKPPETKPPEVTPPDLTPTVEERPSGSSARRWAWAPAAGGVIFAGAGTYFFLQARDKHEQLRMKGSPDAPLDGEKLASEGRQAQTLSRVAFGLGAAGLVTGAVLFLLPGEEAPVRPSVTVGPSGGMVGVAGTLP